MRKKSLRINLLKGKVKLAAIFFLQSVAQSKNKFYFCSVNKGIDTYYKHDGEIAQLVRAHDS